MFYEEIYINFSFQFYEEIEILSLRKLHKFQFNEIYQDGLKFLESCSQTTSRDEENLK